MSISNIQQNYIQYNTNNSTSQYIIQQSSYPNNTPSQPVIVANNYNATYQSYSIPQGQTLSNNTYQNASINSQIISTPDNSNTYIKVESPYENANMLSTSQQGQPVYNLAQTTQSIQHIYNGQSYVQTSPMTNSSTITYQPQQPQPQSQPSQNQLIINTSNVAYQSTTIQQGINQNVLSSTVSQAGMTPVVLKQVKTENKSPEESLPNGQVLPLFKKQPQQQPINFSNSTIISSTNSPGQTNDQSNTNSKSTCIYTPLQTPNSSPIKKEILANDGNSMMNSLSSQEVTANDGSLYQVVGGEESSKTLLNSSQSSQYTLHGGQQGASTTASNVTAAAASNINGLKSISNGEMLSPKSLSNESSNQTVSSTTNSSSFNVNNTITDMNTSGNINTTTTTNTTAVTNNNNNSNSNSSNTNPTSGTNLNIPTSSQLSNSGYITGQAQIQVQAQAQAQAQAQLRAQVPVSNPNTNTTNATLSNTTIPYQSPHNNFIGTSNIQIINETNPNPNPNPMNNRSMPYNTYTSYNNVLSPSNGVVNSTYNLSQQGYMPTQNQTYDYSSSLPIQNKPVQFLSTPPTNVSYLQNSGAAVVQSMDSNHPISYGSATQTIVNNPQVNYSQATSQTNNTMNTYPSYYYNNPLPTPQTAPQTTPNSQSIQQQQPPPPQGQGTLPPMNSMTPMNPNMTVMNNVNVMTNMTNMTNMTPMNTVNAMNPVNGVTSMNQMNNVNGMNLPVNYNQQYPVSYPPVRATNVISANSPPAKVKRYKCTQCGKRFSRPSSLKTHMYSHTGQHPFKCTLEGCGRRFSVLSNLRRHMKVCQKRHEKNRALILRNAKLSNSKIADDDDVNTTTITIDDINSNKIRVIENKKAKTKTSTSTGNSTTTSTPSNMTTTTSTTTTTTTTTL